MDKEEPLNESNYVLMSSIDGGVVIDAIAAALSDAGKEYCHSAVLAMTLIKNTIHDVLGLNKVGHSIPHLHYHNFCPYRIVICMND